MRNGIENIKHASWDSGCIIEHEYDPDVDQIGKRKLGRRDDAGLGVVVIVLGERADGVEEIWCLVL